VLVKKNKGPRVLVIDIETSPIISYTWGLWDQNVALNQIKEDWFILAVAAKWLGDPAKDIIYVDQSKEKDMSNDSKLLKVIWKLMDESDIILTQNGKKFDIKKLNARFILNGFQPPSASKQIDTLVLAKKYFGFTSNKLEYMTNKLCTKYKKLTNHKFSGFRLWSECLAGNKEAWKVMKKYNCYDILSLEELYTKLIPWDNSINFNVYSDDLTNSCKCGSDEVMKNGYAYTSTGKFQRYRCSNCGSEVKDKKNLLSKEKLKSLKLVSK
jgi:DNA polymerase III epsilon subunit-like protein